MADFNKAKSEAQKLINQLGLIEPPVSPIEVASKLGLSVFEVTMPTEFKEVAGYIDFDNKRIMVNKEEPQNRQAFTIAHEIGHFLLHKTKIDEDPSVYKVLYRTSLYDENKNPMEQEANCFAANLLVPKDMLDKYKEYPVSILSSLFQVSQQVISFSLKDLKKHGSQTQSQL